jgi:hypothetical protein
LDHRSAVVYGRFSIGHHWAFKNKLALWLVNVDNQKPVYLFFDENEPVYAVHVKPGTYQVSGFVGLNRARQIEARKEIPGLQKPFVVTADAVIYLGDFSGETEWDGMMVSTWRLKSRTDNFVGTTRELRRKYPNLGEAAVQSVFTPSEAANQNFGTPYSDRVQVRSLISR